MPKYKCTNESCDYLDRVMTVHGTKIRIIDGKAVDLARACFNCGNDREDVREPGITTMISGTNDQRLRMERQ